MEKEIRSFEVQQTEDEYVEGYAAVFNSRSELLGNFVEEIEPGAFADVLENDVFALLNHDANYPLARTKNGTLELTEDEVGLKVRFKLPNTSFGNDIRELLKTGIINKMSFAFSVAKDEWKKADGIPLRVIKKAERLYDISPVVYPAYPETSVSIQARDMAKAISEKTNVNDAIIGAIEGDLQEQVADNEKSQKRALKQAYRARERERYSKII